MVGLLQGPGGGSQLPGGGSLLPGGGSLLPTGGFLLMLLTHSLTVSSVHISRLAAPSVVLGGEELILDCDFDYQEEEQEQLDLKWYFNSSPFPIYQWVPSMHKGPQVIGDLFKGNLDLLYTAHNDTFKKHRALHILRPDHRFSGTYMCKVSSFLDEDFQQKDVLVVAPPCRVRLHPLVAAPGLATDRLNVTCTVEGVHPQPQISLSWTANSTTNMAEDVETVVTVQPSGLLDLEATGRLEVGPGGTIRCQVKIPGTDFEVTEELELFSAQSAKARYSSSGCLGLSPGSALLPFLLLWFLITDGAA